MAEFPAGQDDALRQRIGSYRCSVCRRRLEGGHLRISPRQQEGIWVVSVRCRRCRNQQVFWVKLGDPEEENVSDVSEAEGEYFAALPPVSADDLLDMHLFLRDFDGNFKRLFSV
jgi:hypothetical protein